VDGSRLGIQAWTSAGLELLAEGGVDAVMIVPLAKRLGVTKGSFYWHFKDRDALLSAMLDEWRKSATLDIIERLEKSTGTAAQRLQRLFRVPFSVSATEWAADPVRLWGRRDAKVKAALAEVDGIRLRYLTRLMEEAGFEPGDAAARAVTAYCYIRVAVTLLDGEDKSIMEKCEAILLGV
jgi:AcrR family transcriptional regulator